MFLYNNSVKKMLSTPAELKNELTPSGEFFSYCVIFSLSSKLSDFFPKERRNCNAIAKKLCFLSTWCSIFSLALYIYIYIFTFTTE